jgi:2-haloacid dehalogenase
VYQAQLWRADVVVSIRIERVPFRGSSHQPKMTHDEAPHVNLQDFSVLTFDCYGTLIDWETGLVEALTPVFVAHGAAFEAEPVLRRFATHESLAEQPPFRDYKSVLRIVLENLGADFGFTPTGAELDVFSHSVADWPPFTDSAEALGALKRRYKLVVVSNVDDDLFAHSAAKLGVAFDDVITAQKVQSYKPAPQHFLVALERMPVPREQVLHVAQSLYHDIAPAKSLGLSTVWVNRRAGKSGGATPPADARPDLEVPDLATLASLARV